MDEILASIRKIIDAGETQSRPPEEPKVEAVAPKAADTIVTVPPAPANDADAVRPRATQAMSPQQPRTPLSQTSQSQFCLDAAFCAKQFVPFVDNHVLQMCEPLSRISMRQK